MGYIDIQVLHLGEKPETLVPGNKPVYSSGVRRHRFTDLSGGRVKVEIYECLGRPHDLQEMASSAALSIATTIGRWGWETNWGTPEALCPPMQQFVPPNPGRQRSFWYAHATFEAWQSPPATEG